MSEEDEMQFGPEVAPSGKLFSEILENFLILRKIYKFRETNNFREKNQFSKISTQKINKTNFCFNFLVFDILKFSKKKYCFENF